LALLFWSIFLFWQLFPVFVAGFGANFEFRTLLRFPLSLRAFYIIGLAYGFADFSALASICWLLAMTAGAAVAKPDVLPAMLLIVAAFMLLNVTLGAAHWFLAGAIARRRRTRELFLGLFVLSMVSVNFLSPLIAAFTARRRGRYSCDSCHISPGFPFACGSRPGGDHSSSTGGVSVEFRSSSVLPGLFSALLWRRFAAQYRGEEVSETAAPARSAVRPIAGKDHGPDRLSLLSPPVPRSFAKSSAISLAMVLRISRC